MSQMKKLKTPLHWMRGVLLALLVLAGMPQQVLAQMTVTYFHNEISGSAVAASDSAGRVVWKENYRPYGERQVKAAGSESNGVWFAGKPQEARSGLVYMGARYYDPVAGRFMGVDPLEPSVLRFKTGDAHAVAGNPNDLHTFNRYAYANNNPYRFIDPTGLAPGDTFKTINGAVWDAVDYARAKRNSSFSEYGGWIYRTADGRYSYDEPSHGGKNKNPYSFTLPPDGARDVEWWHTHPEADNAENFSKYHSPNGTLMGDIGVSEQRKKPGNLGTPGGQLKKYIPNGQGTGRITLVPKSAHEN